MDENEGADVTPRNESRKASWILTVPAILSSLGFFLVVVLIMVLAWNSGQRNSEKVRELTRACIERGYAGWADEDSFWGSETRSGCYK